MILSWERKIAIRQTAQPDSGRLGPASIILYPFEDGVLHLRTAAAHHKAPGRPVPALDGSKLLLAPCIPTAIYMEISRFGFMLLIVVVSVSDFGC